MNFKNLHIYTSFTVMYLRIVSVKGSSVKPLEIGVANEVVIDGSGSWIKNGNGK